ncbi:MAG: response regulator, partial [Leptospiraceae bacterium]|nr:response regulator [Leptospiraceae bacterium]
SSISRKYGGLGLGLVICKKYADLLGGDILVESKEKQGSKFSLNFSCKTFNKDLNSISTNPLAWEKIKTLIVEDDILNTLILENFLQEIGFERIDTAEDGAIGWEKIQTEDYDLVITDLHMPNLDGYQLAKKIFQRDSKCPKVIAASADAYEETRKKCFDMGMLAFIPKPFSLKQIKNVIEKVL